MSANKVLFYSLSLTLGAVAASFLVLLLRGEEAQAHDGHNHPELPTTSLLPERAPYFAAVTGLAADLEDGSARLQGILEATTLMLEAVERTPRGGVEGIELPLAFDGVVFGHLRMTNPAEDGQRDWTFELTIPAPPRFGDMAKVSDLTIGYRGNAGKLSLATALVETPLHRSRSTVAKLERAPPILTGGGLLVDETSAYWQPFTLSVEVPESTGVPEWTSGQGTTEPREDSLGHADSAFVSAALFSF